MIDHIYFSLQLPLSLLKSLSYRNQSINFQSKSWTSFYQIVTSITKELLICFSTMLLNMSSQCSHGVECMTSLIVLNVLIKSNNTMPNPEYIWGYRLLVLLRLVTPSWWGLGGTKIFDFDDPRSLEKALSGKELHNKVLPLPKKQ